MLNHRPLGRNRAVGRLGEERWMWLVAGTAALADVPFLRRLGR